MKTQIIKTVCIKAITGIIVATLFTFNVSAQLDSLDAPSIFNRFGDTVSFEDIQLPQGSHGFPHATAGIFELTFFGNEYNGSVGTTRVNIVKQVFEDLSDLFGGSPGTVHISISSSTFDPTTGALAGASPYFQFCTNSVNESNGIIDDFVWKVINSGNSSGTFDGFIDIKFSPTDFWYYSTALPVSAGKYDLYSVVLHEGIHLLGFFSLIGANGQSLPPDRGFYNRYDTYLQTAGGINLIDWDGCFDAPFNSLLTPQTDLISGCSNIKFNSTSAGVQIPVFAPSPYKLGSSLSHLDKTCSGVNYVMHPSIALGEDKRFPTNEDVHVLIDLGYNITGNFGSTTGLPSGGNVVAAVEDFEIAEDCGTAITISPLGNDINATSIACVDVIDVNGTFTFTPGSSTFDFTPGGTGIMTFWYIPEDASGNKGNYTCVTIQVVNCGAFTGCFSPSNCNIVCNPDINCPTCTPGCDVGTGGCVVPDILVTAGTPNYYTTVFNSPNPGAIEMWGGQTSGSTHFGEGIAIPVTITSSTDYILSFYRKRRHHTTSSVNILNNIYIRLLEVNAPSTASISFHPGVGAANLQIQTPPALSQTIYHEEDLTDNTWQQIVVCFTANQNYDHLWIYPEQNTTGNQTFSWLMIDQVELIEDFHSAGADQTIGCGQITIGEPLCTVDNTFFEWTDVADPGNDIGNTDQIIVNINQTTTIYQLSRTFPDLPLTAVIPTSNSNCDASDQVTISATNPITATISTTDETCAGANDGTATVNPSGGTPPYTYGWNTNLGIQTTSTATGLSAGTFTVTVTDANGCILTTNVTINTIPPPPPPVANFTYSPSITVTDICMGDIITFTNLSVPATGVTYLWEFGDGTTSTSKNPTHTYNTPGYYQVVLTVTDICGVWDNSSAIITVIPFVAGVYNDDGSGNCCSNTIAYTFYNHNITAPIGAPEIWSIGNNPGSMTGDVVTIRGTLTIDKNSALIIQVGVRVEFGPNGKLIVKRGGRLTIEPGAVLSGLSQCGTMWLGVEVWGDIAKTHTLADQVFHGKITIQADGIIERAHVAVLLGRTNLCFNPPPPFCPTPPCLIPIPKCKNIKSGLAYGGGIIEANNGIFIQNAVSIKFTPFTTASLFQINFNASLITNCNFNGGTMLDPGYTIGNFYQYSNVNNPFYANATATGIAPLLCYSWNVRFLRYYANTFQNAETGIESHDTPNFVGNLSGGGNFFTNLKYGFRAFNTTNSFLSAQYIISNTFENIELAGIWNTSGQYGRIRNNLFENISVNQSDYYAGIYLENSSGFLVTDNQFSFLFLGIIVNNSGNNGGIITDIIDPKGNIFTKCRNSIFTFSNNSKLQIKCNTHDNPIPGNYNKNWINFGELAGQGKFDSQDPNNDENPAGNEFFPPSRKHIFNTTFSPSYIYYHHSSSVAGTASVIPTPLGPIQLYNTGVQKTSTSCHLCQSCKTQQYLDDKSAEIAALEAEFNTLQSNLDGGNTQFLLDAINSNMPNGQLKNLLLNNSLLSDEVLIALLSRSNPLPPGIIKEILTANSPVSDGVMLHLAPNMDNMPKGVSGEIKDVQVVNPQVRTLTTISREIKTAKNERQLALNGMIDDLLESNSLAAAIALLENEGTVEAGQILAGTYLAQEDITAALNKLNVLPGNTPEELDWIDLNNILIALALDLETVFEIDNLQEQFIRSLAAQIPESPATSNAKSILRLVFDEDFPIIVIPSGNNSRITNQNDGQDNNEIEHALARSPQYLGSNYPDPL